LIPFYENDVVITTYLKEIGVVDVYGNLIYNKH
jgi:hypothetical protein